jgi:hypothetical protein
MKFLVTIHENGFHESWNRGVELVGSRQERWPISFYFFRRARWNWAYRVTSSRSFSSRSAVALRRAFVRGLGRRGRFKFSETDHGFFPGGGIGVFPGGGIGVRGLSTGRSLRTSTPRFRISLNIARSMLSYWRSNSCALGLN